ncbi:MAG TPA: AAA family ATPase [Streptosporangiaceae bacterium]|nr:AAA family ATPase [Streptosporangiaceae bacterium]
MANDEQDQAPGTGPAELDARDSTDEGTFRWPSTGLPKLFGPQPAGAEELPDSATDGEPEPELAKDWQDSLATAPPPDVAQGRYQAPFTPATYGQLLRQRPPADAGEAGEGEQPPWPPAPPPGQEFPQHPVPSPRQELPQQTVPSPTAEVTGPVDAARPAEVADPEDTAGPSRSAAPGEAAEPTGTEDQAEGPEPGQAAGQVQASEQAEATEPAGAAEEAEAASPAGTPDVMGDAVPAGGAAPAEAGSPAEVYGAAAAYGDGEYDPPDGYPMAEYDTAASPAEPVEVPPAAEPLHWQHAETADSLTADLLLPGRHAAPPSGWRRAIYQATGGLVRPPLSAAEMRRRELVARACTPVSGGHYRVAVLSLKGGVGKTTTVMGLGSTLASLRGDRVIAVDANPDRGTLSDKLRLETAATVRDLLNEREQIQRYADVRAFTTQAASRLEVLASDRDPTVSVAFSDQDYQDVSQVLEHYYSICITDCGTGLLHSAMAGVLRLADQIVLVSSPSVDGARSASATLDWLQAHGYGDLVRDAVVVLSVIRPRRKSTVDLGRLEQHFATRCRAVVRIPYDAHLEEGAEVDLTQLSRATADAYLALAAEVGDGFSWPHQPAAAT